MNVTVQYFKYRGDGPGALHWRHELVWLGEDEHGVWLGGPAGCTLQRGSEPERTFDYAFVQLIAPDQWWTLLHNDAAHREILHYVDIVTQPVWESARRVTMFDLDLDVIQKRNGSVYVDDADEFLDHQVRYNYPPQLIDKTRVTAAEVVLAIEAGSEPYASVAARWLDVLRAEDGLRNPGF